MTLDKTQIARRQLGAALALFLEDFDPVSVHTLACAGCEIAEHLSRKAGAEPFSAHALATFPDLDMRDIIRLRNQYWNVFKHATTHAGLDRDDQQLLMRFSDEINDHTLFVGWYDYMLAAGKLPIEAQAFQVWYFALHPDKLDPSIDRSQYEQAFPTLAVMARTEQKEALRAAIGSFRTDQFVTNDPRTDTRPLILPVD